MIEENESNLVQRREDRRTLEKMRRKLATSGTVGKRTDPAHPSQGGKRGMRIWPMAIAAAVLLVGLNFGLTYQGKSTGGKAANQLTPPAGLSLDDQVRFWAYAVYDIPKLKTRFTVPKGVVIDNKGARKQLEQMLAENLSNEVRNEIFLLQQKEPPPPVAKPKLAAKSKAKPKAKQKP